MMYTQQGLSSRHDAQPAWSEGRTALRKRHTLLVLTGQGRERAYASLDKQTLESAPKAEIRRLVRDGYGDVKIPGIVRREESLEYLPEMVPVGFVAPVLNNGARIRVPAFVREQDVVRAITPYDALSQGFDLRNACLAALAEAMETARESGVVLGVWGSASMELCTGLTYTHDGSDLDLLVKSAPEHRLRDFLSNLTRLEGKHGVRIDVELDLPNGYGVQLKEMAANVRSVLGKSATAVSLLPRDQAWLLCQ